MKRFLPLLAVAAFIAVPEAWAATRSAPTMKPGKLTIALNPPAVGFQVGTLRGNDVIKPSGYEIDLAVDIAKKLGIAKSKISWINVPFDTLFASGNKHFDFALEEATITAARARVVSFSSPYMNANQGVLLSKGVKAPHSLAQLKTMSICAQTATTGLQYVQSKLRAKNVHTYTTTAAAFSALQVGRCQAFVMDVPIVASQKKTKPSAYGPVAGQIETHEQYGAVFQKGSKLIGPVDKAIKALTKNRTIATLQKKWFNIDFSKIPVLK